ncbi:MAG TPA: FprA family A-type flavoprotein [Candidatus Limnocylindria bacterium]|nr:FprA family A-type flavoprotein [Candidatus Limnocylindria bacterium]
MVLLDGIHSVGVQNPKLRIFDIIMQTPHGTSYNAYLVQGSGKTALVEVVKEGFFDEYVRNVEQVMPIGEVDYLVVSHTEPDHAGTIHRLLERNPGLQLVGTSSAMNFTRQILNRDFDGRIVKKGDTLDLGNRTLTFYPMPNLHWPDTMFTYDSLSRGLFTCDFLGSHNSFEPLLVSKYPDKGEYLKSLEAYWYDIMAPFAQPYVLDGIQAVRELNPSMVLTGHGAVLDELITEACDLYERLSQKPAKSGSHVAVVYVSAYGYTRKLAETIADELHKAGRTVSAFELTEENKAEVLREIDNADAALFGSPTFVNDMLQPIGELLAALHPYAVKGKPCAAFGSFGWSGEAIGNIVGRLEQLRAHTVPGYKVRLNPSDEELEGAREFARGFSAAM